MKFLQTVCATVALAASTTVFADVNSINSLRLYPREFNDVPGASLITAVGLGSPLSLSFTEMHVSAPTGFANRDVWRFSNGGLAPYAFQHNDYFMASMDLTLTGSPISPRKEGGWLLQTGTDGDVQLIVNTDGHEVVQFGGVSFWSFNPADHGGLTYNSGDLVHLGIKYFLDDNGKNALQFFAGIGSVMTNSPIFEFGPGIGGGANGIDDGSTLGGYFQIVNDPNNANNSGTALFSNIRIVAIPEPSALAIFGLGALGFVMRRRNQN